MRSVHRFVPTALGIRPHSTVPSRPTTSRLVVDPNPHGTSGRLTRAPGEGLHLELGD